MRLFLTAVGQSFIDAQKVALESGTAALRLYVLQMFRKGEKILVKLD